MKPRNGDRTQVFLFVNKDQQSKSLSKCDGATAKEINRHAQQVRNRRVEAQKASSAHHSSSSARRIALGGWKRRQDDSTSNDGTATPSPFDSPGNTGQQSLPPTPTTLNYYYSTPPASTTSSTGSQDDHSSDDVGYGRDVFESHKQDEDPHTEEAINPFSIVRANLSGIDPFGQTPIKITSQLHAVLQHALRIYSYSGNNYKLAYLPKDIRANISQFPITAVIQRSIFKEHHLYSLVACMSARMAHLWGQSHGSEQPEQYRATAAHHLRKELVRNSQSGDVDKQTILDILWLSVNQMQYHDYESARKHLNIVGKLYYLLDTSEHFDHWVSETAAHVDNQLAMLTGQRPVLPHDFDPGPMLPERMASLKREVKNLQQRGITPVFLVPNPRALVVHSPPKGLSDAIADLATTLTPTMGSRFETGLKLGAFGGKLVRIVRDLVDCIGIAKVVWLSPLAVCFDAEWLCRKARSVLRALLSIAPENSIGPMDMLGKCMESARISLLIVMSHACTMIGHETAKHYVKKLQKAMQLAMEFWCPEVGWSIECEPLHESEPDQFVEMQAGFVLWSAMVGIFAAAETPVEDWFMIRVCNMCRNLGLRNFEDLETHMQYYLYSKTLQEASVRRVSKRLEQMSEAIGASQCTG